MLTFVLPTQLLIYYLHLPFVSLIPFFFYFLFFFIQIVCSNIPGVAGADLHLCYWLINLLINPFPPNVQDTFNPKPYELGTLNFERMFTSLNVSHVTCHTSYVTCHMWRVTFHIIFFFSSSFFFSFLDKAMELVGGESVINEAYTV